MNVALAGGNRYRPGSPYTPVLRVQSTDGQVIHVEANDIPAAMVDSRARNAPHGFDTGRLLQADVTNGRVSALDVGDAAVLSPSNARVAFIEYGAAVVLVLREFATGHEQRWPLQAGVIEGRTIRAGGIAWSPDERALVLTVAAGSLCDLQRPLFTLVRLDVAATDSASDPVQLIERPLIEAGRQLIGAVDWPARDKLLVQDWNGSSWWIDVDTGEATTAPPARSP